MGIAGLIPFLEKASRPTNISEFSGCAVAIDAYCWLHRGVFTCADKLARGEQSDAYVVYCMKYVNMLLSKNIKPILVFDGQRLPAKAETEKKRRESRETNRKKGLELLRLDRAKEAHQFFRRSVDINHEMALALIRACRSKNVDCVVAPYEADPQLAFLNMKNIAQVVITEDSDLILFGCSKILFKMDLNGNGLLIEEERLNLSMNLRAEVFCFEKFRRMCILSGCDYLPSLPGIGLVKACKFIKRVGDPDIHRALSKLGAYLNMDISVPAEYRDNFLVAEAMFRHQPVFDPISRKIVPLTPFPEGDDFYASLYESQFDVLPQDTALNLAYGNLDPHGLKKMDDWNPDKITPLTKMSRSDSWKMASRAPHVSVWSKEYKPGVDGCGTLTLASEPIDALNPKPGKARALDMIITRNFRSPVKPRKSVNDEGAISLYLQSEEPSSKKAKCVDFEAVSPLIDESDKAKRISANPWLKKSSKSSPEALARKRNVGALFKFAAAGRANSETNNAVVVSRYFAPAGTASKFGIPKKITESPLSSFADDSPTLINCSAEGPELEEKLAKIENSDSAFEEDSPTNSDDSVKLADTIFLDKNDLSKITMEIRKKYAKSGDKEIRYRETINNKSPKSASDCRRLFNTSPKRATDSYKSFDLSPKRASDCALKQRSPLSPLKGFNECVSPLDAYDSCKTKNPFSIAKKLNVISRQNLENSFSKFEENPDDPEPINDVSNDSTQDDDEGFCSQRSIDQNAENSFKKMAPLSAYNFSNRKTAQCRASGLAKKAPLKGQSLLSRFGFKKPQKLKL